MKKTTISESISLLRSVISAILAQPFSSSATAGAELRRVCGDLSANAENYIRASAFGSPLAACFDAAYMAGMDPAAFARVRTVAEDMRPTSQMAVIIVTLSVRLALAGECRALADVTMTSRVDVESAVARMRIAFEQALDFAMDNHESETFKSLSALYAAVVRDLTERGRKLPQMVSYSFPRSLPAIVLAQRLYSDSARADELKLENVVPNPIFMPASGRALSR